MISGGEAMSMIEGVEGVISEVCRNDPSQMTFFVVKKMTIPQEGLAQGHLVKKGGKGRRRDLPLQVGVVSTNRPKQILEGRGLQPQISKQNKKAVFCLGGEKGSGHGPSGQT